MEIRYPLFNFSFVRHPYISIFLKNIEINVYAFIELPQPSKIGKRNKIRGAASWLAEKSTYFIHNILSVAGVRYICGVPTAIYVM